jgi:hypothetical protein
VAILVHTKDGELPQRPAIIHNTVELCPAAMNSRWARIAKPVHSVRN